MRLGEREASGVQSIDLRARRREAIQNTYEPGCLDHSFGTSQESGFTRAARELDQRISQEYWIPRLTSSSSDILRIPVDSRSRTASHLGPETHHSHVLVSPQSLYAAPVRLVVSFLVPGGLGF